MSQPDQAFCNRFYNRTIDLIEKYQPDLVYFDDRAHEHFALSLDATLIVAPPQ